MAVPEKDYLAMLAELRAEMDKRIAELRSEITVLKGRVTRLSHRDS